MDIGRRKELINIAKRAQLELVTALQDLRFYSSHDEIDEINTAISVLLLQKEVILKEATYSPHRGNPIPSNFRDNNPPPTNKESHGQA